MEFGGAIAPDWGVVLPKVDGLEAESFGVESVIMWDSLPVYGDLRCSVTDTTMPTVASPTLTMAGEFKACGMT